ncbi:MAG: RdgB/HAM1 family non-canonical purine NTP pyrophosphatase [Gammaproteobacteria bacterium]|nr:RdgB/HAM1 family non-canonical purine NTP pyrophosphatase [Gammaproteobacteria bacterium]
MVKIVLASNNAGKLVEFEQLFADSEITIIAQSEFEVPEAEETGLSFIENAILKARNACHYSGYPAIGDDSGLEVDALQGAPGIYSARYAGKGANGVAHTEKLLADMVGVAAGQRQARFCCILAYMRHEHDPTPIIAQGFCPGEIISEPSGEHGFGYDPIVYLPQQGCTMAELTAEKKNRISHRAKAVTQLLTQLMTEIEEIS